MGFSKRAQQQQLKGLLMELSGFSYQKFVDSALEQAGLRTHLTPSPSQVSICLLLFLNSSFVCVCVCVVWKLENDGLIMKL